MAHDSVLPLLPKRTCETLTLATLAIHSIRGMSVVWALRDGGAGHRWLGLGTPDGCM